MKSWWITTFIPLQIKKVHSIKNERLLKRQPFLVSIILYLTKVAEQGHRVAAYIISCVGLNKWKINCYINDYNFVLNILAGFLVSKLNILWWKNIWFRWVVMIHDDVIKLISSIQQISISVCGTQESFRQFKKICITVSVSEKMKLNMHSISVCLF